MSIDDLMIAIIISGIGLTGAYLRAEFLSWRSGNAAERRKKAGLRASHTLTSSRCGAIGDFPGVLPGALAVVATPPVCHPAVAIGVDRPGTTPTSQKPMRLFPPLRSIVRTAPYLAGTLPSEVTISD